MNDWYGESLSIVIEALPLPISTVLVPLNNGPVEKLLVETIQGASSCPGVVKQYNICPNTPRLFLC